MKKIFAVLAASAMTFGASTGAFAQASALSTANSLSPSPCGAAAPVSARFLEGGRLEVTCPKGSASPTALSQTGLTSAQVAGIVAGAIVVLLIADTSSSTTSVSLN